MPNYTSNLNLKKPFQIEHYNIDDINNNMEIIDVKMSEVNSQLAEKATKTELQAVANGSPKGVYATLTDLQTAYPTGATGIYLVTADGKWYYWNGSWQAGGTYQSTGLSDKSVTLQKLSISETTDNKWLLPTVYDGQYTSNGTTILTGSTTWSLTDYISGIAASTAYYFTDFNFSDYVTGYRIIVYCYNDSNTYLGNAITTTGNTNQFINTTPKSKDFTTLADTTKIRIQIYKTLYPYLKTQICEQSKFISNSYIEPYKLPYAFETSLNSYTTKVYVNDFIRRNNINKFLSIPINQGYWSSNGTSIATGSSTWSLTDYIEYIKEDTLYYFTAFDFSDYVTGYRVIMFCYDDNNNYLGNAATATGDILSFINTTPKSKDFTTLSGTTKVRLQMYRTLENLTQLQLCEQSNFISGEYISPYELNSTPQVDLSDYQKNKNYMTNVNKPYSFSGKTASFFGDSITAGTYSWFDTGTHTGYTVNNWVSLFSTKVGLTPTNYGIGGNAFARNAGTGSILDKILATTVTSDYIFICGGTNDCGNGVTIGSLISSNANELYGALNELATHLKTNYPTKEIIFILPINRVDTYSTTLDDYRQAIYNVCILNGFSVVDGSKFGFPSEDDDLRVSLIADSLHPTELGHKLYARGLQTEVC